MTTRKRRASEIDGVHYRFIDRAEFERLRDGGALLEWAEVHGNFYGTPRAAAEKAMRDGRDMLFDIDYQGALQLQEQAKADVVSVFILPPSMTELKTRLLRRAEDSGETIAVRLKNAKVEIDTRTPAELIAEIQARGREVTEALEALKAVTRDKS